VQGDDDVDVDTLEVDITGVSSQGSNGADPSVSYVRAKAKGSKPTRKRRKLVKFLQGLMSGILILLLIASMHLLSLLMGCNLFLYLAIRRESACLLWGVCLGSAAAKRRGEDVGKPRWYRTERFYS
jgi:hypothetical protein